MNAFSRRVRLPFVLCLALPFTACDRVSRVSPADQIAAEEAFMRAVIKQATGPAAAALPDIDSAITHNPAIYYYYGTRGRIREEMGDMGAALDDYTRTVELARNFKGIYDGGGSIYHPAGDRKTALKSFFRNDAPELEGLREIHLAIWLLRARRGEKHAADKELTAYFADRRKNNPPDYEEWETRIGDFLLDKTGEIDLRKPGYDPAGRFHHDAEREFLYYISMKKLRAGDKAGAVYFYRKCFSADDATHRARFLIAPEPKALGEPASQK